MEVEVDHFEVGLRNADSECFTESRGVTLREVLIVLFVISHFSLGLLSTLPYRSKIWELPVFRAVGSFYRSNRLDQSWRMFSPPPVSGGSIQYSVHFPGGWTSLFPLNSFAFEHVNRRLVQPPGMFRMLSFFRASADDITPDGLSKTSFRAFYYQQISYYFCSGGGKIPGIIGMRFYFVGYGVPNFFDTDKYGQPLPPISEYNSRLPLYEQQCSSK